MRPFYRGGRLIEVPVKRESTVHDILYFLIAYYGKRL